jgi:hypothetical protein
MEYYKSDEKHNASHIPEIKYLPVSMIHRKEMDFRPEVMSVPDHVAKNMDYSEPIQATAYRDSDLPNHEIDRETPQVTLVDGHHRTAAAIQTGKKWLPVKVSARNVYGHKLNKLIAASKEIESSLTEDEAPLVSDGNGCIDNKVPVVSKTTQKKIVRRNNGKILSFREFLNETVL